MHAKQVRIRGHLFPITNHLRNKPSRREGDTEGIMAGESPGRPRNTHRPRGEVLSDGQPSPSLQFVGRIGYLLSALQQEGLAVALFGDTGRLDKEALKVPHVGLVGSLVFRSEGQHVI